MLFLTDENYQPNNIKYGFFNIITPFHSKKNDPEANNDESIAIINSIFNCHRLCFIDQKHTNKVILIDGNNNFEIADGMVCKKPRLALAILTADCVPILFADEQKNIIAAVHSGWRGARANIIAETILAMKRLGASSIKAIIGPCIKQPSYEVDNVFYQDFISENISFNKFFIPSSKHNHFLFDLTGYVKEKLNLEGIDNIFDINKDTYIDEDNYFSFRRHTHNPQSKMGNFASVIMIK